MQDPDKLLNTREVAEILKYSQREMQEWCRQGKFKTARRVGREWRISESEVSAILKGKDELPEQINAPQAISEKLILDITKLAERIEWLIYTPEPKIKLLDYSSVSDKTKDLVNQLSTITSLLNTGMRTLWWCTNANISVYLSLSRQSEALFNRFLGLTSSHKFQEALSNWKLKADIYLKFVRSSGEVNEIKTAYREAKQTETVEHKELWEAVESLRWTDR
jgi:excisionase family DNA binding protein